MMVDIQHSQLSEYTPPGMNCVVCDADSGEKLYFFRYFTTCCHQLPSLSFKNCSKAAQMQHSLNKFRECLSCSAMAVPLYFQIQYNWINWIKRQNYWEIVNKVFNAIFASVLTKKPQMMQLQHIKCNFSLSWGHRPIDQKASCAKSGLHHQRFATGSHVILTNNLEK